MATYDPSKIRPRRDFCLVKTPPRAEKVGSLFLPGQELGMERVTEREGTVTAIGPGEKAATIGLNVGDRIVYRGFLKVANPVPTDEKEEYFLMAIDDVLIIIPSDSNIEIGCFSGRPEVPEFKEN
jgi:co-chaperonin GroES (HSP10)